jgi:hypothetical protein
MAGGFAHARRPWGFSKYGSAMISFLLLLVSLSTGSAAADEARIQSFVSSNLLATSRLCRD